MHTHLRPTSLAHMAQPKRNDVRVVSSEEEPYHEPMPRDTSPMADMLYLRCESYPVAVRRWADSFRARWTKAQVANELGREGMYRRKTTVVLPCDLAARL